MNFTNSVVIHETNASHEYRNVDEVHLKGICNFHGIRYAKVRNHLIENPHINELIFDMSKLDDPAWKITSPEEDSTMEPRGNTPRFSLNAKIVYHVERRLFSNPREVNYAWTFDKKEDAQKKLFEAVVEDGKNAMYSAWFEVEDV